MSTSHNRQELHEEITPPSSFVFAPLTPPSSGKKPFVQAGKIITLFKTIRAGKHIKQPPWSEFQLSPTERTEINRQLDQDEDLRGFVEYKIRYDFDAANDLLVVRMPTAIHELFLARVEEAIHNQLKSIYAESTSRSTFAKKVKIARSTRIHLPNDKDPDGIQSKYEPDTSFWHDDAEYPGVVIEVAYSEKRKHLTSLADAYLLDSDANIQSVVGLDIEYGEKRSRKATLSVWRTRIFHTAHGDELRAVQEIVDEAFRDEQGNPTNRPGLQLHLSDFANKGLVRDQIGTQDQDLVVSTKELCQFLTDAEEKVHQLGSLSKDSLAPGVTKRKRSETPPEELSSSDEARYVEEEERAVK
ncbi:hypothetical protein EJ05DRAFT_438545 [Pseudovirgaria hyperparasitica]|uniref:Uncharacterized protein n=1 Tax=Pseudovirgaria hyperparasitica TaxID=470096 RepID=A0A6A6WAZ7_9PEZI|nr:uncharacterized protein EJ05DRAFT_438545 [Pseudovirgaria hyperparasitica]KAF2758767.1 hypothetical protein EJ05DRAFT_438545 [Pseudovirgaria hyperparasitica]